MRFIWNEEYFTVSVVSHVRRDGLIWVETLISESSYPFQETDPTQKN